MAKRRMFSPDVLKTDRFCRLPHEAQSLYVFLCLDADDDGFLADTESVARSARCGEEAFRTLLEAGYLLAFPDEVYVIRHWPMMNRIQRDRYTPTIYLKYLAQLQTDPAEGYVLRAEQPEPPQNAADTRNESSPAAAAKGPEPDVPELPMENGGVYTIPPVLFAEWRTAFADVDVLEELRLMRAWLLANPDKQKTAAETGRFIFRWLHNAQKNGGSTAHGRNKPAPGAQKEPADERPGASYDLARAVEKMNTTVPKFKKRPKAAG